MCFNTDGSLSMRKPSLVPTLMPLVALVAVFPALADFRAGLDAFQKGDYTTAAKEWRPEAEEGDPGCQFNLGLLYLDGHGVPQSYAEAVNWFRRAAEQDYTPAQHNLGAMYGTGQGVKRDYVQAYKWLNICAAKGNAGCARNAICSPRNSKPVKLPKPSAWPRSSNRRRKPRSSSVLPALDRYVTSSG